MSQYGQTAKNPPWVRSGQNMTQNAGPVAQNLMANTLPMTGATSMLQYPPVFQGQLSQQMGYGAVGAIQYPTRALNSQAFQTNSSNISNTSGNQQSNISNQRSSHHSGSHSGGNSNSPNTSEKSRVFTGTVTKLQDNFGFVNDDIFFQTSCCVKGSDPQVGDRVLVEAVFNANMPFKWNASRIQVLPSDHLSSSSGNMYNAVPPPNEGSGATPRFGGSRFSNNDRSSGPSNRNDHNRNRNPRQSGPRPDNMEDRKRKREDNYPSDRGMDRERERSNPPKRKSKSPMRRSRQAPRRPPPRYTIVVPKYHLASTEADLMRLTKRHPNLYVPSDFFLSKAKWIESFPISVPLSLNFPCNFYVMHKDVDSPYQNDAALEPSDLDYLYVAKVMLLSSPGLEDLYQKTGITYKDDREGSRGSDDESVSSGQGNVTHLSRLIHFLVGTRGKEAMAIGGPWSPSLDGSNPESDPGVLVKTAIRTCKAQTGIDLSACTQWFRFLEIHYHRAESVHHGKVVPARVETVVLFVPDVWSASPSRGDWETITADYKTALDRRLNPQPSSAEPSDGADMLPSDEKDGDISKDEDAIETTEPQDSVKKDPSHYSQLDPKSMKVNELRDELEARNLSPKGLKSQLVARLTKSIKTEADEEEANGNVKDDPSATTEESENKEDKEKPRPPSPTPSATSKQEDDKKKDEDKQKDKKKEELSERDKARLEKRYRLPENPQILVHPSRQHKSGKFDCMVTSLSSLLSYTIDDSKEHSFEVTLFAEVFNEMLMRDFGFNIYKVLVDAPEKRKDDDKDKKKDKTTKEKGKEEEKDEKESKDKKDNDQTDGDEDKSKSAEDRKKEDKKPRIIDNNILLAFSYFDTTRCGYIYDKDLGDILNSLGLSLSRSQIKKLVQKVSLRDTVHYKKLAEKVKEEGDDEIQMDTGDNEAWEVLCSGINGNRRLLAIEKTPATPSKKKDASKLQSGFVMHKGTLVDINKLLDQLVKSEKTKMETERALTKLKADFAKIKETSGRSERTIKDLQSDIRSYKDKLASTYSDLSSAQANERTYFRIISDVGNRVSPIIKKKEEDDEAKKAKKPAESDVLEIVELVDDDIKEGAGTQQSSKDVQPTESTPKNIEDMD